jgi:hypothetical protein
MRENTPPFTATAKTTYEQSLPDGNEIRGYIYTHQARDSAGRTRSEMGQGCRLDENGVAQPQLSVSVRDPEAKTFTSWQVGMNFQKIAHVTHQRDTPSNALTPDEIAALRKANESRQPQRSEFKAEDLGTRTIAGVDAKGSRNVRTIPAGREGNKLPLVITTETWMSKEFGFVVLAITDDPRRGRTTYEVEELSRSEPDPSLFAPPAGYTIEDRAAPGASGSQP